MITWLLNHIIILAGFNLINSHVDAYRIIRHKNIAHGVNLGAYATLVGLILYLNWPGVWEAVNFCFAAFFNRQLSFDIPLNRRRGLPWDYQSTAERPGAVMDRIERWLFGKMPGKWIAAIYAAGFLICSLIKAILL